MVNVVTKRCSHEGCTKIACFGLADGKPTRCADHTDPCMEDVRNPRCKGPGNDEPCPRGERAYQQGMCLICLTLTGVRRERKLTEARCLAIIERAFGPRTPDEDAKRVPRVEATTIETQFPVSFACSDAEGARAFVDAYLSFPNVVILLEIDELAHCRRGYSCDVRRMESVREALLMQSADARPIAWVRFNPDEPDGATAATPAVQKRRARTLAVAAIRELVDDPRSCIVYVNFPAEM